MASTTLYRLTRQTRFILSLYPVLFFPILHLGGKSKSLAVTQQTDIVIEGFPRSANSFAVGAFQFAQKQPVSIANHLHAAAQIVKAAQLGIPAILLIRSPVSAVLSLRSLNFQTVEKRGSYHPVLDASIKNYLMQWIRFYSRVKPFHNDYVIGVFDEVTSDFGAVVNRVNRRFSTSFELFDHTPDNVQTVHEIQGYHAGPSSRRQDLKQRAKQELEAANCEALIAEANALYQKFVELAHQQTLTWSQQNPQSP
ncbi:MAG: hypothetical protein WBA57_19345 [Elainellaceae cyanobacterium]